jgi:hypothetical protein
MSAVKLVHRLLKGVCGARGLPSNLFILVDWQSFCSEYRFLLIILIAANALGQNIPNELKNKTSAEVIKTFFTPPVGALIAAMVSTFGEVKILLPMMLTHFVRIRYLLDCLVPLRECISFLAGLKMPDLTVP